MRRYDPISRVFYTCSTRPPIPETLDFIGFSDGLEDQKSYVFSPSVLPKIRVCLCVLSFRVSKGDFLKFPKEISGRFQKKLLDVSRIELLSSLAVVRSPADITAVLRHYKHAVRLTTLLNQDAAPCLIL